MKVREIMTGNPAVCGAETPLQEVARLMCANDCGAIPVVDARNHPVGIVTDRDIACRAVAEARDVTRATARDIMSEPIISVAPEATVEDCCDLLEDNQLRRILVVDVSGAVCGIVAQADIARFAPRKETAEVVREVSRPEARRELEAPV